MLFSEIMPTVLSIPNDTVIQFISFFITATIFVSIPFVIVLLFTSYRTKTSVVDIIMDKFGTSPIPGPYRSPFVLFSLFVIFSTLLIAMVLLFYIIPLIAIFGYWLFSAIFDLLVSIRP